MEDHWTRHKYRRTTSFFWPGSPLGALAGRTRIQIPSQWAAYWWKRHVRYTLKSFFVRSRGIPKESSINLGTLAKKRAINESVEWSSWWNLSVKETRRKFKYLLGIVRNDILRNYAKHVSIYFLLNFFFRRSTSQIS